jgi:hypothetical protein
MRGKAKESEIIDKYKIEQLYNHPIEQGRFFKVVFLDEDTVNLQLSSKTYMQIKFLPSRNDVEGFNIIKLVGGEETQRISFSKFNFAQLELFLKFIRGLDLCTLSDRRLKLSENSSDVLDEATKKTVTTLLQSNGGADLIQQLLDNEIITSQDIVNTGYRKRQLQIFKKLLDQKDYWQEYRKEESDILQMISDKECNGFKLKETSKEEITWQYFFSKNPWIFGYGLDYRFQNIIDFFPIYFSDYQSYE